MRAILTLAIRAVRDSCVILGGPRWLFALDQEAFRGAVHEAWPLLLAAKGARYKGELIVNDNASATTVAPPRSKVQGPPFGRNE